MKKFFYSSLLLAISFLCVFPVHAADFLFIDKFAYPQAGPTSITSDDGSLTFSMGDGSISADMYIKMMTIAEKDSIGNFFSYPENLTPASDLYFIRLTSPDVLISNPQVTVKYKLDGKIKDLYYFDWMDLQFKKLEATRDLAKGTLTFTFPIKEKLMFALFDGDTLSGRASWYVHAKYPTELTAASRDLPIGSKIKVTNPENNKEVIVTIKDYGPKKCSDWTAKEQETMGPCQERVLDLSKTAFSKIANLTQGVINVIIKATE